VVPECRITSVKQEKRGGGVDVTATVQNIGNGRMPVEIAATEGERWLKTKGKASPALGVQDPAYHEARGAITLGAGESKTLTIHCAFAPKQVVVDPDVRVLQLKRKQAVATL